LVTLPINNDIRSQGLDFDNSGNLWIANSGTTKPLAVYTVDKKWKSFTFENIALPNVLQLMVASSGQKWLVVERNGMIVYDDAGTPENETDDKVKNLKFEAGKGGIPGSDVFCMAEDRNGEIWLGTDKGVGVFYAPQTVFDESAQDAQPIKISQDGYVQFLLESEKVTAIAVDNANRKWVGTANTGVYLMSSDGTQQLKHFTEENSPLISNGITAINILETTGEVFFGTEKGIISYKDVATEGFSECKDVLVYPNPVRENYSGPIAIRSVVLDAIVKITDATGALVFETKAYGGQAIWDGTNFKGEKVATGIYFAFASNADGSKGCNAKILVIR
jgi:ligand-binding sensor domain-containing protein